MSKRIVIIDYSLSNLFSVKRAIEYLGAKAIITDEIETIAKADSLILPGVGAFGAGMAALRRKELVEPIKRFVSSGKPVLGICLGMQLFMTQSEELGIHQGFDFVRGKVVKMPYKTFAGVSYKIPHIGWEMIRTPDKENNWKEMMFNGVKDGDFVYFLHSYVVILEYAVQSVATTRYGDYNFCSFFKKDNLYGCQFHPEKSAKTGLMILQNFLNLI